LVFRACFTKERSAGVVSEIVPLVDLTPDNQGLQSSWVSNFYGESLEDLVERILMFIVGVLLVAGGIKISFHSLEGQRAAFQLALFGTVAVVIGLYFCIWTFTGLPQ